MLDHYKNERSTVSIPETNTLCMRCLRTRKIHISFLVTLLFLLPAQLFSISQPQPQTSVTVDFSSPAGISHFSPGISHIDTTMNYPWDGNDLAAVNNVKSLIKGAIPYENTPIMAWGVSDPWPNPAQPEPSNWSSLDSRLHLIMDTGGMPVITLSEAPWWMKGQLQPNGTTRLVTQSEEWSDIAYSSRILDNKMGDWLLLVQRVAERYMVSPYNVRYFQVWNELKGYFDPATNTYDYTDSPGVPTGPNAKHGYTYMYNQVYERLMQVATSLGIPGTSIRVGGPYVVMDTYSSTRQSSPSTMSKPYGVYDQRPLDVVQYWLQHKVGAGFITVDGEDDNKDGANITDPFTASQKFADITHWIRSLSNTIYPGAATLPVWWAEWNASPYTDTKNDNYNNAIKTVAMLEFIKVGGSVALLWGGTGVGTSSNGLWTPTIARGGQPLPWYYSYKAFKNYFAPGTTMYKTSISDPASVDALASATRIMLVNKTAKEFTVKVNGMSVSLLPYQVSVIDKSQQHLTGYLIGFIGLSSGIVLITIVLSIYLLKRLRSKSKHLRKYKLTG